MRIGIVGLPLSGKTTVFQLLSRSRGEAPHARSAEAAIAPVKVPDPRLDLLAKMFKPKKVTPVTLEYLDLHAKAKTAKGLDGQLIAQLRQTDALVAVIRAFEDLRIPGEGKIDPAPDAASLESELFMADLEVVEKRIGKIEENLKKGRKEDLKELELLKRCREKLLVGVPLRDLGVSSEEERMLRGFQPLTLKPLLLLLNLGEGPPPQELPQSLNAMAAHRATALLALPAKVELELVDLSPEEAEAFRKELGLAEPALDRLIKACYDLLGLITFFTVVGEELRAWAIPKGTTALKAAGTIHSDMEKGFIKAEVIGFEALKASGSYASAKKQGLLRLEGKDYIVQDGDILTIRFSP